MSLHLHFDDVACFRPRKRSQRLAALRAVLDRLIQLMHFNHDRQGGAITAAVTWPARLLAPFPSRSLMGLATGLGTSRLLALFPIETLGEVAYLRFKRFHLRFQGRFALRKTGVLGSPVVRFPLEGNIVLLRQHDALFGEGGRLLAARGRSRGSGAELGLSRFHKPMLYQLFWKSPVFLMGLMG